jgi:hypothetical protein
MIKLNEIVQSNNKRTRMIKLGKVAKAAAAKMLSAKGMLEADYFILRIKPFNSIKNQDWIALYRTHSVLSGRPIFWMNEDLERIAREIDPDYSVGHVLVDNILHEYWHAIMDMFRALQWRQKKVTTKVQSMPDQKEEDDAEDFMRWVKGIPSGKDEYFETAIKEFNAVWADDKEQSVTESNDPEWKKDWLERHRAKLDDKGRIIAYHGTPTRNLPSIRKNGFRPRSYFTLRPEYAKSIATTYHDTDKVTVIEVHLPFDAVDMVMSDIYALRNIPFGETQ